MFSTDRSRIVPLRKYSIDDKSICCTEECYLKKYKIKDPRKGEITMFINSCTNCGKPTMVFNEWKAFEAKQVVNYAELDSAIIEEE